MFITRVPLLLYRSCLIPVELHKTDVSTTRDISEVQNKHSRNTQSAVTCYSRNTRIADEIMAFKSPEAIDTPTPLHSKARDDCKAQRDMRRHFATLADHTAAVNDMFSFAARTHSPMEWQLQHHNYACDTYSININSNSSKPAELEEKASA